MHVLGLHVPVQIQCKELDTISVKGIAYPVVTYKVLDTYETLGRQRQRFREVLPNAKLDLDLEAMTAEDRGQVAEILRRALDMVSLEDESARPERATREKSVRQG